MVDCKYCGENTQNKNAICNSCKNKLNAKKYLKTVLKHFKPEEILTKRKLGIYLDKSLNVDIVLLTLNDYGMVVRRGGHGYKLANKKEIDEFLSQEDLTLIKSKKTKKSSKTKPKNVLKNKNDSLSKQKSSELKKCKICGTTLPENSKSDMCRKCSKKTHAIKVLEEIIPITGVGIPFKKEDLNNLYKNNPIKANDTIWTLQDFNLVNNIDTNVFELVSESKINEFFKENHSSNVVSDLLSKTSENALQKTCLKCNKTLPISEFRKISEDKYSDYCKNCDKKIKTAQYVIEFINTVGFDEFKISDINIENAQGKIFNLQDNDLITFNGQSYKLAEEDFIYSYINQNIDENSQFDNILNAFKDDITMIQAAKSVGVSNTEVTKYYIEGKNGNPKYVYFYNEINKIKKSKDEKKPCPKCKKSNGYEINGKCKNCGYVNISILNLNEKMDFVLAHIKKNNSVKAAKELNIPYENVKNWNNLGKSGISPYDKFYNGIINIKNESKDNALKRRKIVPIEERLNENLRQIQSCELTLDKNTLKLKNIDLSNKNIKSEYDEVILEINIMKNDLIFQKNEIRSIKENLSKYSLEELENVKIFEIKNAKIITPKVNKLLKINDEYIKKITEEHNNKVQKLEGKIKNIKENIEVIDNYLSQLDEINFAESLKSKSIGLIKELKDYKSELNSKINYLNNGEDVKIDFTDFSFKFHDLISNNEKLILKQMQLVMDNLDMNKDLNQICNDLNVSCNDVRFWYSLGKSGNNDYEEFYTKIFNFNQLHEKIKYQSTNENLINECEDLIKEINIHIEEIDNNISKLNKIYFIKSLKSEKYKLIGKLNGYRLKLNSYLNDIKYDMSRLKDFEENFDFKVPEIDFADYSTEVNDLISKNQELASEQMKLIIDNLDETKELREIYKEVNVSYNDIKLWMDLGKEGNENYVNFYEKISEFKKIREKILREKVQNSMFKRQHENQNTTQSNKNKKSSGLLNKLVNKFSEDSPKSTNKESNQNFHSEKLSKESQKDLVLKYYAETKDFNQAANLANVQLFLVKFWYNRGKNGDEQYIDFYNKINKIKEP